MKTTHEFLRSKLEWYQKWDDHKYSCHFHWAFLVLFLIGVFFGLTLQIYLLPPDISQASALASLNFTSDGTEDGGVVKYSDGARSWTVTLPGNFTKVETAHYDPNNSSVVKKYMGWNGYLKINKTKVWEFKSWSSETGGIIYDDTLGEDVKESTGSGLWLDVTNYVQAGSNIFTYYHYTGGDGIGLRVKVATGGISSYCGDGTCDSSENCSSCASDCLFFGKVCCSNTAYTGNCCSNSDCDTNYECSNHSCIQSGPVCGDSACDSNENCSSCSSDCACGSNVCCSPNSSYATSYGCVLSGSVTTSGNICCNGTDYTGDCCTDSECNSGYKCSNHSCASSIPQAVGLGKQCFADADCDSNNCANKYSDHFAGLCMPNAVNSSMTVVINHVDERTDGSGSITTGKIEFKNSNGQSYFDNLYSSSNWNPLQWTGYFCGQNVYRYETSNKYYYKATDGTNYWYGERNVGSVESVIINALEDIICKTAVSKKADGSSCSASLECINNYCVRNKCHSSSTYCGDGYCDSGENCSTCAMDCLALTQVCCGGNIYTGECCSDSECLSDYKCSNHSCEKSGPTCGDGICDSAESCECADCSSKESCQTKTHIINISSIVNVAEQGMANEVVKIIYSKDYWDINQKKDPLTNETLKSLTENIKQTIKELGFDVASVNAELDEKNYTLIYKFDYFNYSSKGKESNVASDWVISLARGEITGEKNICQLNNFKANISGLKASMTFDYENKYSNEKYNAQKTIHLPNNAENINFDKGKCLLSYDTKSPESATAQEEESQPKIAALKNDGESCSQNKECASENCFKDFCRPQNYTYCGDKICQDDESCDCDDCSSAPKCQKPKFDYAVNAPQHLKAGETKSFEIEIHNKGEDKMTDVELKMYLGQTMKYTYPECAGKEPCVIKIDDINPNQKIKVPLNFTEFVYTNPVEKSIVQFYLKANNSSKTRWDDIKKEVEVKAEPVTLLADLSQVSVAGEQNSFQKIKLRLSANNNWQIPRNNIKVKIKPDKEDVAAVNVSPSFAEKGYALIDSLNYNNPKTVTFYIDFQKIGYTNVGIEVEGDNIERIYKSIPVEVMARPPVLEFAAETSGLIMEESEKREITLTLKNKGSGLAYQPKVEIDYNKDMVMVLGTSLPIYFDSIEPGKSAAKTITLSALKPGNVNIDLVANCAPEPASPKDNIDYKFKNSKKINLAIEETKKVCQDDECSKQVDCLVEVSNIMGCGLEVADIIPYFDKPTAVILATSDFCDIKERAEKGDPIGSSVTAFLATADMADNAGEAIPVAGNVASAVADTIEGAADCMEGFVYDTVDKHCASGSAYGGYTGCFDNMAATAAYYTGQAANSANSINTAIFGMFGSPVSFRIVDNNNIELGPQDGVLIIEQGELKTFLIKNPEQLKNGYDIELMGTDDGTYHLRTALIADGKVVGENVISNHEVKRAESQKIALAVAQTEGEITNFKVADTDIKLETGKSKEKTAKETTVASASKIFLWIGAGVTLVLAAGAGFVLGKNKKK